MTTLHLNSQKIKTLSEIRGITEKGAKIRSTLHTRPNPELLYVIEQTIK
jgi:hypothetical protein